jgi:hypothetical protein
MQIGEEDLSRMQPPAFLGLRLLDLDDEVGLGKDRCGIRGNGCPGLAIIVIAQADASAGATFHHDLMPMGDEFAYRRRG